MLGEVESIPKALKRGRQCGFSPINGNDGAMRQKQVKIALSSEDMEWLESQPNQSEAIRQSIALYRKSL